MDVTGSLPHSERLRNRGAIRRLFEGGKSGFVYPLRYMWFSQASSEDLADGATEDVAKAEDVASAKNIAESSMECQVLFTVPKRFHKRANKRNLLRRRVKESYRLQKGILSPFLVDGRSIDLALVYSTKDIHSYKTIENAVRKILEHISKDL